MTQLSEKRILLTGASSGIGEALAKTLAQKGARLILSSRREPELERVRQACEHPERHVIEVLDMGAPEAVLQRGQQILERYGGVDVVIHNAGISQRGLAVDTKLEVDRRILEVNFLGPVALTKALLPGFIARRSGHIVVISSVVGYVGTPQRSAYSASKHALHGWFDSLRAELHASGVPVTIACPGYVRTDVSKNALEADGQQHGVMDQNQQKGLSPEACAAAIVRAIERNQSEVVVGGLETWAIPLKRFFPSLIERAVRSMKPT